MNNISDIVNQLVENQNKTQELLKTLLSLIPEPEAETKRLSPREEFSEIAKNYFKKGSDLVEWIRNEYPNIEKPGISSLSDRDCREAVSVFENGALSKSLSKIRKEYRGVRASAEKIKIPCWTLEGINTEEDIRKWINKLEELIQKNGYLTDKEFVKEFNAVPIEEDFDPMSTWA
jgi:hypothetical protein